MLIHFLMLLKITRCLNVNVCMLDSFCSNKEVHIASILRRCKPVFYFCHMTRNARWQSRRPRHKAAAHVPDFDTLVPAPELSLSDAKNNPFGKICDTLYRERQLWSVKIRYMSGNFVAGTSALSPGLLLHVLQIGPRYSNIEEQVIAFKITLKYLKLTLYWNKIRQINEFRHISDQELLFQNQKDFFFFGENP